MCRSQLLARQHLELHSARLHGKQGMNNHAAAYWLTPEAYDLLVLFDALDQYERPHRPPEEFQ